MTESLAKPERKPRRRFLQFSLRTLLILGQEKGPGTVDSFYKAFPGQEKGPGTVDSFYKAFPTKLDLIC